MATQHIIDDRDIDRTHCDKINPMRIATDPTPWPHVDGDIAIWDNDENLPGFQICMDCVKVYEGN